MVKHGNGKKLLIWRWLRGDVPAIEVGDPTTTTRYALCAYDETAQTPTLAVGIGIEPGPLWSTTSSGFRFKDITTSQQGAHKIGIKGGSSGRGKLQAKASGLQLPLPGAVDSTRYFNQQDDVTVQLVNDAGGCWEAVYPPGSATNRVTLYRARQ
jgi:hypothetical protein